MVAGAHCTRQYALMSNRHRASVCFHEQPTFFFSFYLRACTVLCTCSIVVLCSLPQALWGSHAETDTASDLT